MLVRGLSKKRRHLITVVFEAFRACFVGIRVLFGGSEFKVFLVLRFRPAFRGLGLGLGVLFGDFEGVARSSEVYRRGFEYFP